MIELPDLRVLFFGDSFTAGVGDAEARGWVGRVVSAVIAAGRPVTAYNLGVRHQTSVEVAARLRAEAIPRVVEGADCRAVIAVGANDTTIEDGAGAERLAPDASAAALDAMLAEATALGLAVAVAGPPPLGDEAQRAREIALSHRFARVCTLRSVPYWPVTAALMPSTVWDAEIRRGDQRHPSNGGYDELARLLLDGGLLGWLLEPARAVTPAA